MGPRLAILAVVGILYVWIIVATIPLRRAIVEEQDMNDYYKNLDREVYIVEQNYVAMKENPNSDPEDLLDKEEKLALLYWEKRDFPKAIKLIQDVVKKRNDKLDLSNYDEKWVGSQLRLAGIYRDITNWNASKIAYEAVLGYDQAMAAKHPEYEEKLARDYNNLGLVLYMEACGHEKKNDRIALLKQSAEKLEKALEIWRKTKGENSFFEGNTLWNLYLVQRDMGLKREAEATKLKAMSIDKKSNRKAVAPL
ncbi:MAG TPA: tetratricopeptide repeat protein [Candidatus Melainabacteria bacterium]|nr:tetratricopeptide repeat protein [Candidatus Melainabacteria bacterium]HMP51408.1 tetratricopeptide repeat protein [Candidatus Melainabacteria bacterium]